jgi:hypothetical protein
LKDKDVRNLLTKKSEHLNGKWLAQKEIRENLNGYALRNRDSPEAGVSCLIHQVRSTFLYFCFGVYGIWTVRKGW